MSEVRVTVAEDAEDAARTCAERLAATIEQARAERGLAHLALAGGRTPARTYELLAALVPDWRDVHLWFGDERCVPLDDPDSNHRLLADTLLAALPDDPARGRPAIHPLPGAGDGDPAASAAAYERELRAQVAGNAARGPASAGHATGSGTPPIPRLDLALLGLGEDGHTASLFPDDPLLAERERLCVAVQGRKPPFARVSTTLPLLRAARAIVVLTAGTGKAWAVGAMLGPPDPHVPASLLAGGGAAVELIADRAAAPLTNS